MVTPQQSRQEAATLQYNYTQAYKLAEDPKMGTAIVLQLVTISEPRDTDTHVLEAIANSLENGNINNPSDVSNWIRACILASYELGRRGLTNVIE